MDGYLGIIEARLDKIQAQLNAHAVVLAPELQAQAERDAAAAEKAAKKSKKDDDGPLPSDTKKA